MSVFTDDDIPSGYNLPPGCFQEDIDRYFKEGQMKSNKTHTFSDEDLKQLKEKVNKPGSCMLRNEPMQALLARLEAAELYCEDSTIGNQWLKHIESYKAWRKACGK